MTMLTRLVSFCALSMFAFILFGATKPATAATETVLYTFDCSNGCGPEYVGPNGPLVQDKAGNLYGTVSDGFNGQCNTGGICGYVYELSPNGSGGWNESVIYSFKGGLDGADPIGGVIMDAAGNLYGATAYGGGRDCLRISSYGCGTVYELSNSGGTWTETILSNFSSGSRGAIPAGGLVFDSAGNLYGTTSKGGPNSCNNGTTSCGTVFELSPGASGWTQSVIYDFKPIPDAASPYASLAIDSSGRLYGVATGGAYNAGAVYRLKRTSTGWAENVIWNFTGGTDGSVPQGVVVNSSGNVFGTAFVGGSFNVGTVFELTPGVGNWNLNVIHTFTGGNDGGEPQAGPTLVGNNLFGTASLGGLYEYGTVFRLTPSSGQYTESVLYNFTGGADGGNPNNPLTAGPNALFGSTNNYTQAVVYELSGK